MKTTKGRSRRDGPPLSRCLNDASDGDRGSIDRGRLGGDDVDGLAATLGAELHLASDQREQGVVAAPPHALTGVELGPALPDDDLARVHRLPAEPLDPEPLGVGVTTVAGAGRALLVCHGDGLFLPGSGSQSLLTAMPVTRILVNG